MSSLFRTKSEGRMQALLNKDDDENESQIAGMSPQLSVVVEPEERDALIRRMENSSWTIDRGAGYYAKERERQKRACLVQTGRHAGRSRVKMVGVDWSRMMRHVLRRDFFNAAVNTSWRIILCMLCTVFFGSLSFWTFWYYITWLYDPTCFSGFDGLVSAFLFAVETQQTIGYGARAPGSCWVVAWLVSLHSLCTIVIQSVILGIAFARISHPKNRGRTILVSDCAIIARRDGVLKFMFRVADLKAQRQVTRPSVAAYMFTWGQGHTTLEGENIPCDVKELTISYKDPTLLLPVVVEHIIDESSPLYGHTQQSLEALGAEIVVVFQGATELGDTFMVRQSYLPTEIHWGHMFVPIIRSAREGETQHSVDVARFHDVEPQPGLDVVPPYKLSKKVVSGAARGALPAPILSENTLVLSDDCVVCTRNGRKFLMFRVGDTYPGGQMCDVSVIAHIYRWQPVLTPEGEVIPYTVHELSLDPVAPSLRYPVTITHEITESSPLANWVTAHAKRMDADAELVVTVRGTAYANNSAAVIKTKVYPVMSSVKYGYTLAPLVMGQLSASAISRGGAQVQSKRAIHDLDWSQFHAIVPSTMIEKPVLPRANAPAPGPHPASSATPAFSTAPLATWASGSGSGSGSGSVLAHTSSLAPGYTSPREKCGSGGRPGLPSTFGTAALQHGGEFERRSSGNTAGGIRGSGIDPVPTSSSLHMTSSERIHKTRFQTEGSNHSVATTPTPPRSIEHSLHTGQATGSHFDVGATSWRHTRSLFTAIEEMQKLAAAEEAAASKAVKAAAAESAPGVQGATADG